MSTLFSSLWILSLFFSCIFGSRAEGLSISVVTEEAISLQYKSEITDQMEGPAAELVEKVIKTAGIDFTTKVLPWARAYKEAEQTKNTLIYSILRTPVRESKFHWIGVISKPQYYLFAIRGSTQIKSNNFNAYKNAKIGTLLNSASYHQLKSEGFTNLAALNNAKTIFQLLKRKRVDFITVNKRTFQKICEFNSVGCDEIIAVAPIDMPKSSLLYFAINKESDPELVKHLKTAYKQLKSNGGIVVF